MYHNHNPLCWLNVCTLELLWYQNFKLWQNIGIKEKPTGCVTFGNVKSFVFCPLSMFRVVCWQSRLAGTMAPTSSTNRRQTNRSGFLLPPGETGEWQHTWLHTWTRYLRPHFILHHQRVALRPPPQCSRGQTCLTSVCPSLFFFFLSTAAALFCCCSALLQSSAE